MLPEVTMMTMIAMFSCKKIPISRPDLPSSSTQLSTVSSNLFDALNDITNPTYLMDSPSNSLAAPMAFGVAPPPAALGPTTFPPQAALAPPTFTLAPPAQPPISQSTTADIVAQAIAIEQQIQQQQIHQQQQIAAVVQQIQDEMNSQSLNAAPPLMAPPPLLDQSPASAFLGGSPMMMEPARSIFAAPSSMLIGQGLANLTPPASAIAAVASVQASPAPTTPVVRMGPGGAFQVSSWTFQANGEREHKVK